MPIRRHFLGWDEPLTEKVGKFLLSGRTERPVTLADTLVVVPTQQAGRRLRQTLARMCAEQGTALLSARIVMPSFFLAPVPGAAPDADSTLIRAVWTEILMQEEPGSGNSLIPDSTESRDAAWAMRLGDSIGQLRDDLAEGGLTIGDALKAAGGDIEEPERWAALARLESRFTARLAALKLSDPCERKIRQAANPPADFCAEFRHIVLASVPDPMPLALKALEKIAERIQVDVLIWADQASADMFDEWGRPRPESWEKAELDVPDVMLAGSPESQAKHAMDRIAALPAGFGPRDLAIGVPDRSIVPFIENELEESGLTGFDPSDRPLKDHPIYRLLASFCALATDGRYASVSAFLRQAEVLRALEAAHGVPPARVLAELDEYQNERLPVSLADFEDIGADGPGALQKAITFASGLVATFAKSGLEPAVRALLEAVYGGRETGAHSREYEGLQSQEGIGRDGSPSRPTDGRPLERRAEDSAPYHPALETLRKDRELERASEKVGVALTELAELSALPERAGVGGFDLLRDKAGMVGLFLGRLEQESYHSDRRDEQVDLEGWLELPWNDAPALIVTGMNEGIVPSSSRGGQFLPNSLRRRLSLRDDSRRLARDAYFTRALVESHRRAGRISFIVGKTGISGEPLRPSRLLFRCPDDKLVERAALLFAKPRPERSVFPPTMSFKLNAGLPSDMPADVWKIGRMNVTSFRDYLACPFRFYLKHVLEMEAVDDTRQAPDELQFGTLVHAVFEALGRDKAMRNCDDEKALRAFLHVEAERQVKNRFGDSPPVSVAIALDTAMQRLSKAAQVQAELAGEGWEIVECEKRCELQIGGMTIVGKLDRLDRHRDTGALRVLDYKTSDKNEEPSKIHLGPDSESAPEYARVEVDGKIRRWLDLQLPLYLMMAGAGGCLPEDLVGRPRSPRPSNSTDAAPHGGPRASGAASRSHPATEEPRIEVGYFALPKAVSETGVSPWKELGGELLESARACVEGVVRDIRRGRFWPPADMVSYGDDFERLFHAAYDDCVDVKQFPFKG